MWYHFLRQDQSPMDCFNLTINEFFRGRNKSEIDVKSCFRCFLFLFLTKMQTQWKFLQKSWHAVLDIAPYLAAKQKERHNERQTYKPIKIWIFNSVLSVGLALTSLQPPGSQCSLLTSLPVTSCFRYLTKMIYILWCSVCLCVTKNHHFLLGVSCDHLN